MSESMMPAENEKRNVTSANDRGVQETREAQRYLSPPVDIYETKEALFAVADMPGVEKQDLAINVDQNILSISGKTAHRLPENLLYGEFELLPFHRRFQLSEAVDQERISAELKNGVLTVQLPKAERVKPKRIDVKVG